jgi:NAD(P)-dependent dehydrogenase (short-subunit alcohol dehydrogenase family)
VTGTSSGLGRSLVEEVLAAGERVVATTRRASGLASLTAAHSPESLLVLELDILSNDQIKAAFQQIKKHFGRVDVVVNNAGYALKGEVEAVSDELAMMQMDVNFWGPVRISREVRSILITLLDLWLICFILFYFQFALSGSALFQRRKSCECGRSHIEHILSRRVQCKPFDGIL